VNDFRIVSRENNDSRGKRRCDKKCETFQMILFTAIRSVLLASLGRDQLSDMP